MRSIAFEHGLVGVGNTAVVAAHLLYAGIVLDQVVQVSEVLACLPVVGVIDDFQRLRSHGQVEHARSVIPLGLTGCSLVVVYQVDTIPQQYGYD